MIEVDNQDVFIEALLIAGVVTQEQIDQALREHQITGENIKNILVKFQYITPQDVLAALGSYFGMETISLKDYEFKPDIVQLVPFEIAEHYNLIPLYRDEAGTLHIAVSDPLDIKGLDEIRLLTSINTQPVLALADDVKSALGQQYTSATMSVDEMIANISEDAISVIDESAVSQEDVAGAESAPVIKLVSQIMYQALKERASDIHIEPRERTCLVRYRVDGMCHEIYSLPKRIQGPIIARLKLMAGCDLAERRIPQDGRIKLRMLGRELDLRFSALPSLYGESLVMRILDKSGVMLGLEQVGFLPETVKQFENIISKPNGIILVTGPTGSGKTTTLYAALNKLNTPDRKIITIEDPVEYQINGINQMQVRADIGLDFAAGLRSILRQSPDVLLVGEIRDQETAEIAIRAALTGHLVFSTLHTNDSAGAVTRLIDMGINPYLIASSVEAIMAQRLVRVICNDCKEPYEPDEIDLKQMGVTRNDVRDVTFFRGGGCDKCNMTGYKGRTSIFELLMVDQEIKELILESAPANEIHKLALSKGMITLRDYGFLKVKTGTTTILEVQRITVEAEV